YPLDAWRPRIRPEPGGRRRAAPSHPTGLHPPLMSTAQEDNIASRRRGGPGVGRYDASVRLSVAPMMDWTDSHCRVFHLLLAPNARLYTEMVHANAVIHGDRARLLALDPVEHPVALQLGGSEPALLAQAAHIGAGHG